MSAFRREILPFLWLILSIIDIFSLVSGSRQGAAHWVPIILLQDGPEHPLRLRLPTEDLGR